MSKKELVLRTISSDEHNIKKELIDTHAIRIIQRLNSYGYQGYIVGGAVRDLICGREPKDFDIITDATPNQIRRIFRNSRIIGRRFKLVHIFFNDLIFETATFRTAPEVENDETMLRRDNEYGTIEDDVIRRDFSFNALYYDPLNEAVLDYVDGFNHIKDKVVKTLKNEKISFTEDPVRMLRVLKYSTLLDFQMSKETANNIKKYGKEISKCSKSRLYEEYNKIFRSGNTAKILEILFESKLLKYLMPFLYKELSGKNKSDILEAVRKLDELPKDKQSFNYEIYWAVILYKTMSVDSKLNRLFEPTKSFGKMNAVGATNADAIEQCRRYFLDKLFALNVPRKICEDLGKAYFIYRKFNSGTEPIERSRQYKFQYPLVLSAYYFEFYCENKEIVDYIKVLSSKKRQPKPVRKEGFSKGVSVPTKSKGTRKFVETARRSVETVRRASHNESGGRNG